MSNTLTTAILAAPIILIAWYFLGRCREKRIYVTEIGIFLTVMISYTFIAFSLVTNDSPNWMPGLAICSTTAVGASLSLVMRNRIERRLKAMHQQQDDSQ